MIDGLENICRSGQSGMPEAHMQGLLDAATSRGYPIIVRPVSPLARYFLEQGYPTKPFAVKNKSSKQGPMAGLIAIEAKHSRIDITKTLEEQEKKHLNNLQHAREDDKGLCETNLVLSLKRINELFSLIPKDPNALRVMTKEETKKNGDIVLQWENGKKQYSGIAKPKHDEPDQYEIFEKNQEDSERPIQVLGRQLEADKILPITADYDLFCILIPYKELDPGNKDKPPHHMQRRKNASIFSKDSREISGLGNVTPRFKDMISVLNNSIAEKDEKRKKNDPENKTTIQRGLELVHHNQELYSPAADVLKDNLPLLFVLPAIGNNEPRVVLAETVEEVQELRETLMTNGFYWPSHFQYSEFALLKNPMIAELNIRLEQNKATGKEKHDDSVLQEEITELEKFIPLLEKEEILRNIIMFSENSVDTLSQNSEQYLNHNPDITIVEIDEKYKECLDQLLPKIKHFSEKKYYSEDTFNYEEKYTFYLNQFYKDYLMEYSLPEIPAIDPLDNRSKSYLPTQPLSQQPTKTPFTTTPDDKPQTNSESSNKPK